MTLLILAQPEDETTKHFVAYALGVGINCVVVQDWCDIDLLIRTERDCSVVVDLYYKDVVVNSVMNRGIFPPERATAEEAFWNTETVAAWWAALAYFTGPVVNCPSRWGFIPRLEPLSIVKSIPCMALPSGFVSTCLSSFPDDPTVSIHRLQDGYYVGRLTSEAQVLDKNDTYVFTPFDPSRVISILLAGKRIFNLSVPSGSITPELAEKLKPLVNELHRYKANFSLAVIELTEIKIRVLSVSAFPSFHEYQHLADEIYRALLEYLVR